MVPEAAWRYHWPRFSALVLEAGHVPRTRAVAHEDELLLKQFIPLVRRYQRMPTVPEQRIARRTDKNVPSSGALERHFGDRNGVRSKLVEFCRKHSEFDDVVELLQTGRPTTADVLQSGPVGYVYLIKSGTHYKIGRSNSLGRREYELAIQLPQRAQTIHAIETDDAEGIENYWHRRFASKRGNGEWFKLTADDVAAFKRRKKFM